MSRPRGLTVTALNKHSPRQLIQNIVTEHIRLIDALIIRAHQSGFDHVEYELPVTFGINNMDKSDAQMLIYSELIDIYTRPESDGGKGFNHIGIDLGIRPKLHITWLNGMSDAERTRRNHVIDKHLIRK